MNLSRTMTVTATIALASLMATGCGPKKKVTRTAANSTEGGDLSGYWNDIDANLVSEEMIKDCLGRAWASDYQSANGGKKPVVKLMGVTKRTDDRNVNTEYFSKRLERELLNSGRVRVVAGWGQDSINVVERARQATHASDDSVKSHGNETGADFTLQTVVNSQNETDGGGQSVRAYLVNMELISVETNEKVWIGEKQIRKVVDQAGTTW
jgi:PBP1b-binding outer membrane lipoprotein LpoB